MCMKARRPIFASNSMGGIFTILWLACVDDDCGGLTSAVVVSFGDEQLCRGRVRRPYPCFCGRLTALFPFDPGGRLEALGKFVAKVDQNGTINRPQILCKVLWSHGKLA